ncbi:MAG TPA: type VI secretion system-associated FHA domain protein TagH [Steroidobacteraceae bacterium]
MSAPKSITLEIIAPEQAAGTFPLTHTFDLRGGTFGRADDNDWVIRDEYVSRYQGLIGFANGAFFVSADPRANAKIFVNGSSQVVPPEKRPLAAGDKLAIDKLVIRVGLSHEFGVSESRSRPRPAADPAPRPRGGPFGLSDSSEDPRPDAGLRAVELDVDQLMGGGDARPDNEPTRKRPRLPEEVRHVTTENVPPWPRPTAQVSTPAAQPAASSAPAVVSLDEKWWERLDGNQSQPSARPVAPPPPPVITAPAPPPEPVVVAMPTPGGRKDAVAPSPPPQPAPAPTPSSVRADTDFNEFLKGAGLDAEQLDPQVLATLGRMLRIVVAGVIESLRARNEIRKEFRLPVTVAEASENNPLKFSANAADALYDLLVKRNPSDLAAIPAFEEAFEDLRHHQLAVLKGMRMAYGFMLSRFDPERLQQRFEAQAKSASFAGIPGRARPWEQYCAWFAEQGEDEDDCFRRLFGDEFGKVYERELERLANLTRATRKRD